MYHFQTKNNWKEFGAASKLKLGSTPGYVVVYIEYK